MGASALGESKLFADHAAAASLNGGDAAILKRLAAADAALLRTKL
jgi:hypothetical protein